MFVCRYARIYMSVCILSMYLYMHACVRVVMYIQMHNRHLYQIVELTIFILLHMTFCLFSATAIYKTLYLPHRGTITFS